LSPFSRVVEDLDDIVVRVRVVSADTLRVELR
jgi:hypothetical protein